MLASGDVCQSGFLSYLITDHRSRPNPGASPNKPIHRHDDLVNYSSSHDAANDTCPHVSTHNPHICNFTTKDATIVSMGCFDQPAFLDASAHHQLLAESHVTHCSSRDVPSPSTDENGIPARQTLSISDLRVVQRRITLHRQ